MVEPLKERFGDLALDPPREDLHYVEISIHSLLDGALGEHDTDSLQLEFPSWEDQRIARNNIYLGFADPDEAVEFKLKYG